MVSAVPDPGRWHVPEDPDCTCDGCLDAEGAPAWRSQRQGLRPEVVDAALSEYVVYDDLTTQERREIARRARAMGWSLREIRERTGIAEAWRYDPEHEGRFAEKQRAYYEANREEIAEKKRAYREANREEIAEKKRAYYRTRTCVDCGVATGGTRCRRCHGRRLGQSRRKDGAQ